MKCGCKRNLLGVCSCKRVSRGRGRRTRRAITDEPYERAIRPRYAVPKNRRPELNFPAIDSKRPGQVLKPGVPSVSTGFTAPSPFSRGAVSAFEPVLRAASNYLNEVTRSARLQNQMTMSNMGGGGASGASSNYAINGSVTGRNTGRTVSMNPTLAPVVENLNFVNSNGSYQSRGMDSVGVDQFEAAAELARRNLNRTATISPDSDASVMEMNEPQNIPQNNINYQDQVDQTIAENNLLNESMNDALNPFYEDDNMTDGQIMEQKNQVFRLYGEADINERKRIIDAVQGGAREKSNFVNEYLKWRGNQIAPQTPLSKNQSSSSSPSSIQTTPESSNFGPDRQNVSSLGSPMYPSGVVEINSNYKMQNPDVNAIDNLMNTGFSSPVFAKANSSSSSSSSSNIGGNSKSSNLRKLRSPFGDQDKKKDNFLDKGLKGMEYIIPDSDDVNTEDQMEPSEFTDGSVPISSVSSKSTRQSAIAGRARAKEIADANKRNKVLVIGGGGQQNIEKLRTNIYENDPDLANIRTDEDAIRVARMLAGQGFKSQAEQERLQELAMEEQKNKNVNKPINVENVFTPVVKKKINKK